MTIRRSLPPLRVTLIVVAATWLSGARDSRGQSDQPDTTVDSIKADLEQSKNAYQSKIDTIKKEVTAALDSKIAAAEKKKGGSGIVEKLSAEKAEFEEDVNKIPPSLAKARAPFAKRMTSARNDLATAYKRAIRSYGKLGNDAQANAVKSEFEEFLATANPPAAYQRVPEQPDGNVAPAPPAVKLDPKILVGSRWNFTIRRFGFLDQPGAFKISNGVIYHLDASNPVGEAAIDAMGQIHLSFVGHRKITVGEAVVRKVANGKFQGVLNLAGDEWAFEIRRR